MATVTELAEAIGEFVHDGDTVALEGFTHLIPHAAGHELIRQDRRQLHLVKTTPDVVCDQLIGAGCAAALSFSWGGNPGVGSLHRFRDAVESDWPRPLEIDEHTHDGMVARYVAGASGLPHAIAPGYTGTDLMARTDSVALVRCPFTGRDLPVVAALHPDVTIIHAQQADSSGNVQLWGIVGVQKEAALAADRVIVTVEEVVDELRPRPNQAILHHWTVDAVCPVPDGAHPSYAAGYSERDNGFYRAWDAVSRDRDTFRAWIERHVRGTFDHREFLELLTASSIL